MLVLKKMLKQLNIFITILCFLFIFSNITYSINQTEENNQKQNLTIISDLPFSLGKIYKTNINNNESPDIIIINDIHCQEDAQKNIYSIIQFIKNNIDIDKIFIEGASKGKVNTSSIYDIDKSVREKILTKMLNEGLVNGTEYYCYITNTDLYGIEDSVLYMETLQQAYLLMKKEDYFSSILQKSFKKLKSIKKKYYSKDMFDFEHLFFNRTNIKPKQYSDTLTKIIEKYSIDLNKYHEIHNFICNINYDTILEPYKKNYSKDFTSLIQKMKNDTPIKIYNEFIKTYKDRSIEENLIYCYKYTNQHMTKKEKDYYVYIETLEQKYNIVNSFNISKYLDEEEKFYEEIFNKIFTTQNTKDISFINQMLFLTQKYAQLNIDFYNFDKFIKNKDNFIEILNNTSFIENKDEIFEILNNAELTKYYDNNIKRDTVFFNNIENSLKENSINILVVGGFHKNLLDLFNDNGKKYIVIFPNTKDGDNNLYKQIILDIGSYNFISK